MFFAFSPKGKPNQTTVIFRDPSVSLGVVLNTLGRPGPCRVPLCLPSPLLAHFTALFAPPGKPHRSQLPHRTVPHPGHSPDTFSAVRRPWRLWDLASPPEMPSNQGRAKQPDAAAQSQRTVLGNPQLTPPASQKPTEAVPEAAEGSWQGSRAR